MFLCLLAFSTMLLPCLLGLIPLTVLPSLLSVAVAVILCDLTLDQLRECTDVRMGWSAQALGCLRS